MTFLYKKYIPAFISFIIITTLLCLPSSALPKTSGDWFHDFQVDKIIHIALFAFLVFMFCRPVQLKGFFTVVITKVYLLVAVLFSIYGIIIEFIQDLLIPGRSFEGLDIVADAIGCFVGYFIARNIVKKVKKPSNEEIKRQLMDYSKGLIKK